MRGLRAPGTLGVVVALAAGCPSVPEQGPVEAVQNVSFRLGDRPDSVELRLEGDYFPAHNYEIVARDEGKVAAGAHVSVTIAGARAPLERKGSAAPAAGRVVLPRDVEAAQGEWWLLLVLDHPPGPAREDSYKVEHGPRGWRVTPEQGSFSRFEATGSN